QVKAKMFSTVSFIILFVSFQLMLAQQCEKKDMSRLKKAMNNLEKSFSTGIRDIKQTLMINQDNRSCCIAAGNQAKIEKAIKDRLKYHSDKVRSGDFLAASDIWDEEGLVVMPDDIHDGLNEIKDGLLKWLVDNGVYPNPTIQRIEGNCDYQVAYGICEVKRIDTNEIDAIFRMIQYWKYNCLSNQWQFKWEMVRNE
ncbi:unnamed protein product, partial [Owenia fusiformis]